MLSLKVFAAVVSLAGWGLVLYTWLDAGPLATRAAGYGVGLALGAGFAIIAASAALLSDARRAYAVGFRDGRRAATERI
ncbi:hypothetical protein G7075_04490 [Phycicoccus sp. HDW14]|uniref:hypothetical protein n=1 Tax=Phycicoccus sp. HDW14 TaxID=2714941 RepID=UPI00140736D6|nr:hypothetical protein [Phycicoccus sp. HDW14]QIM20576.1 hypothetical protein G7075_04490 [Phycicoccus sp. HDW14]